MRDRSRLFDEIILKSWWTILFFLLAFFIYDRGVAHLTNEENKLKQKYTQLIEDEKKTLEKQEELKREIESQDDAAWIEMTLMRCLGLVPEGQTKVHFIEKGR